MVSSTKEIAYNLIPEMLIPTNLITIDGYINDEQINIIVDTGSAYSHIFKSTIDRLELSNLVDKNEQDEICGNGITKSLGRLWYQEIELNSNYIPISFLVIDDIVDGYDVILGNNFLQSYDALLDYNKKKLILNKDIEILFNN
jgi:hypothetical protein